MEPSDRNEFIFCFGCMKPLNRSGVLCPHCGYDNSKPQNGDDLLPEGTILSGQYLVGRKLGKGGFGVTYLGYDLMLDKVIAIKEYFPMGISSRAVQTRRVTFTTDDEYGFSKGLRKFREEALNLSQIETPGIVRVRNFFPENGTAYIIMDFVQGTDLNREIANKGRLPWKRVVDLFSPLILELDALHKRHLIHRDIKPANIKVVPAEGNIPEHLVLLDFGSARSFISESVTGTYTAMVTPGFAPIEQYDTEGHQGPYTDVYGLCATMYNAITGKVPPVVTSLVTGSAKLKFFREFGLDVPEHVEKAIRRGMVTDSIRRTQSMQKLYEELNPGGGSDQEAVYRLALKAMASGSPEGYEKALVLLSRISGYQDADELAEQCRQKLKAAGNDGKEAVCRKALKAMAAGTREGYEEALGMLQKISGFQDADELTAQCQRKLEALKRKRSNKGLLTAGIILLLLAAGVFAWALFAPGGSDRQTQNAQALMTQSAAESAETRTAELIAKQEADFLTATAQQEQQDLMIAQTAEAEQTAAAETAEREAMQTTATAGALQLQEVQAQSGTAQAETAAAFALQNTQTAVVLKQAQAELEQTGTAIASVQTQQAIALTGTAESIRSTQAAFATCTALAEEAAQQAAILTGTADAVRAAENLFATGTAMSAESTRQASALTATADAHHQTEVAYATGTAAAEAATRSALRLTQTVEALRLTESSYETETAIAAAGTREAVEMTGTAAAFAEAQQAAEMTSTAGALRQTESVLQTGTSAAAEATRQAYELTGTARAVSQVQTQTAVAEIATQTRSAEELEEAWAAFFATQTKQAEPTRTPTPTLTPTPTCTPTPGPTATPTRTQNLKVGDIITFGAYEQDNDLTNGAEPIEWQVLAVEDDHALVISRYGLDVKPYNETNAYVTWETCTLRNWLNGDFYNSAFSSTERTQIQQVTLQNPDNQTYAATGGNSTTDRIFLLSIDDVRTYFSGETARQCEATAYAKANGAYVNSDNGDSWWWLRSPGGHSSYAGVINIHGIVDSYGRIVNYTDVAVRPAFWLDVGIRKGIDIPVSADEIPAETPTETAAPAETGSSGFRLTLVHGGISYGDYYINNDVMLLAEPSKNGTVLQSVLKGVKVYLQSDEPRNGYVLIRTEGGQEGWVSSDYVSVEEHFSDSWTETVSSDSLKAGDIFYFGSYEQDNDLTNGAEPIEWQVLAVEDGCALVISRYALDTKPYNETRTDVTWETCTLRVWLNNDFFNSTFSNTEKDHILQVMLQNPENPTYGIWGGNSTTDRIFLLSIDEIRTYFSGDTARLWCKATAYAEANGAYVYNGKGYSWWWLRSPGIASDFAAYAFTVGQDITYGYFADFASGGVRPAFWLNMGEPIGEAEIPYEDYEEVGAVSDVEMTETAAPAETGSSGFQLTLVQGDISYGDCFINNDVLLLAEPSKNGTVLRSVLRGVTVYLQGEEKNGYVLIKTEEGQEGWVPSGNISVEEHFSESRAETVSADSLKAGDIFYFGSYEQDNDLTNGTEPIEWQVLAVEDGRALVISRYALDAKPYYKWSANVTWETCTLRTWLNNDFFNSAFTNTEKDHILQVTLQNPDNPDWGTKGGNSTTDRIFLLSIAEVLQYFDNNAARQCEATAYAKANGAYVYSDNGYSWWWPRSPGFFSSRAATVSTTGSVGTLGIIVSDSSGAVRPAFWLDL